MAQLPEELAAELSEVRSVGVITGAGVSRDSGIPTYRGPGGLYDDPTTGAETVAALSAETLRDDPSRTWRVLSELIARAGPAAPNPAHLAIAAMERRVPRFVLLTQNVDGLHRAAGNRNVIDIHGDASVTICTKCGEEGRLDRTALVPDELPPRCRRCRGILRPGVVLFGEVLPPELVARVEREFLVEPPDCVITTGTSSAFPYIQEPVLAARRSGRITVEVDPGRTALSDVVDYKLDGSASEWLPVIAAALPNVPG